MTVFRPFHSKSRSNYKIFLALSAKLDLMVKAGEVKKKFCILGEVEEVLPSAIFS